MPLTAKSSWVASAFRSSTEHTNEPPELGIDGNEGTRYSSGEAMRPWDWYRIDFGERVAVTSIEIKHSPDDHARGYEVVISDAPPGHDVPPDLAGENSEQNLIVETSAHAGRYLHIRQTGTSSNWWSILEVEVSCQE